MSDIWFQNKYLRSVSRAVLNNLVYCRSFGEGEAFGVLPSSFFSIKLCGARLQTHLKLLDSVVSAWCQFFNCRCIVSDIAHRLSITVLCMLYLRSGSTCVVCTSAGYPRCFCCSSTYIGVSSRQNQLAVPHDFYPPPICFYIWNYLADLKFDFLGLAGFKSRANAFLLTLSVRFSFVFYSYPFLLSFSIVGILWGWGCKSHSSGHVLFANLF